jgi:hypothetical protein
VTQATMDDVFAMLEAYGARRASCNQAGAEYLPYRLGRALAVHGSRRQPSSTTATHELSGAWS